MPETISSNKLKFFKKLLQKKYRDEHGLFLVEGWRACCTFAENAPEEIETVIVTVDFFEEKKTWLNKNFKEEQIILVKKKQIQQLTDEKSPQGISLVVRKKINNSGLKDINGDIIFLDRINDPGNLGTIIRTAFWFDIKNVFLSPGSVDLFNPKTVRASAGYISSLNIIENVLEDKLTDLKFKKNYSFYATVIKNGSPLDTVKFKRPALLFLGSEAFGLNEKLISMSDQQITVRGNSGAESLNIAVTAAILMYQLTLQV